MDLREVAFRVATARFTFSDGSTLDVPLFMQRENVLELQDVDVEINGQNKQSVDDNDNIDKLKPGDVLDFDVNVENRADKDSNLEVENTEVRLDCSDEEDLDIDDDTDEQDIAEDSEESFTFQLTFDEDAKDGTTGCDLGSEGKDIHGARHGDDISFDLEIERESHDISLRSISVDPSEITCQDTSFQVNVEFVNLGKSDEDETAVEVESRTLNYAKKISNIQVDEDDSRSEVFDVLVPAGLSPGAHLIQVRTFYDNNKASDSEVVQVNNVCGEEEPETPSTPSTPTITLSKTSFTAEAGDLVSIQVRVTNTAAMLKSFTVSLQEAEEFAEPVSSKVLTLNEGQTSTVFLNVKVKPEAQEGDYSALIAVESDGQTVATESVVYAVEKGILPSEDRIKDFVGSTVFWVLIDILLVVAAIVILWLIFRKKE
ncbi:MAG: hypothetical protein AABX86_02705 [Nanoarchaeota archaeon]